MTVFYISNDKKLISLDIIDLRKINNYNVLIVNKNDGYSSAVRFFA